MVIRRATEWLILLTVLVLLTLIPLYNGYRAYVTVEQFIQDLPMLLTEHTTQSDSRGNGTAILLIAQEPTDDLSTVESSFADVALLYDVRSADGGSLFSPLLEQSLPICRVVDESAVTLPITSNVSSPSRHLDSHRR